MSTRLFDQSKSSAQPPKKQSQNLHWRALEYLKQDQQKYTSRSNTFIDVVESYPGRLKDNVESNQTLVAFSSGTFVEVAHLISQKEEQKIASVEQLPDTGDKISALCWAPNASTQGTYALAAATSDSKIHFFNRMTSWNESKPTSSSLKFEKGPSPPPFQKQTLAGHSGDVHSISMNSEQKIVSTGEDQTVRLWSLATQQEELSFPLSNAGKRVKFHTSEHNLFAGADQSGLILLFDSRTPTPVRTWQTEIGTLYDMDWSPESDRLIAVAGQKWFLWKNMLHHTSPAAYVHSVPEAASKVRFSSRNPATFASLGISGSFYVWDEALPNLPYVHSPSFTSHPTSISWLFNSIHLLSGGSKLFSLSLSN